MSSHLLPKHTNINTYIIILPGFLYGCETWFAIVREGHSFENRVLTKIFGLKKEKGTADWRKPHHEESQDAVCCSKVIDCRVN